MATVKGRARQETERFMPAPLGKRARSSHDPPMPLNLAAAALNAFLDRGEHRLGQAFATLPDAARGWLHDSLPRAQALLAADGRVATWQTALAALPDLTVTQRHLGATVRATGLCDAVQRAVLRDALMALAPWRKGPFELFGLHIDSEWRSDLKWSRVLPQLTPLHGRRVLDVGCGNGYYLWRMAQSGAALVLGIDPALAAYAQFAALNRYIASDAVHMLPLASDALDTRLQCFDTVFSMGVLYHRRDHHAHLQQLRQALRSGGELLLETLVLVDGSSDLLIPEGRYAAMRNVWAVPSPATVEAWLRAAGFHAVRTVDISATTLDEQRSTAWMPYHSLRDFLAPDDPARTIEGYPAPVRAVFVASAD